MTGMELPVEKMVFERHKEGTCQGRIYYRGPIAPTSSRQMPKIKLDLTVAEILVDSPVLNFVKHPYSDLPTEGMQVYCYSYVEVFAEKTRALAERTRPRDLYDVINLYRRPESNGLAIQVKGRTIIAFKRYSDEPSSGNLQPLRIFVTKTSVG